MKAKLAILFILSLLGSSCKKERTCNCTISESGNRTTHSKTAGTSISIIPGIPPIELSPAKDTTFVSPYMYNNTAVAKYDKVSKGAMRKNCAANYEESVNEQEVNIVPGSSTITITQSGIKTYSCKIE